MVVTRRWSWPSGTSSGSGGPSREPAPAVLTRQDLPALLEAPQLFARQMADGAWGMTLAKVQQDRVEGLRAAEILGVPYTEVNVEQMTDVYQVQRTLKAVLEAQPYRENGSLIEKIMQTDLLVAPY